MDIKQQMKRLKLDELRELKDAEMKESRKMTRDGKPFILRRVKNGYVTSQYNPTK